MRAESKCVPFFTLKVSYNFKSSTRDHVPSLKTMVDPVLLVYSADGPLSPAKTKTNLGLCGGGLNGGS